MNRRAAVITTASLAALTALAGCTSPQSVTLEAIPMVNHIQFGVFEQDVFVPRDSTLEEAMGDAADDDVYRATPADAADPDVAQGPLYTTAIEVEHDPTFSHEGPFPRGDRLPFTLAQWLAATSSAAYACVDDQTSVSVTLQAGVPRGVYTVWNFYLDFEGGAIVGGADIPAGPADGSANTFTADGAGNARFTTSWDGCPEASTFDGSDGRSWGVGLAYHSDGRSHGPSPGEFGLNAHVQLFGLAIEGDGS